MAPFLLVVHDKVIKERWYHMTGAVVEGEIPFNEAHGMSLFEYSGTYPKFNKLFNQAMSNYSTMWLKEILELYDGFEGLKSMVDVGGGTGATLNMIISKYPSIKGINFDLPHVLQHAPSYLGVENVGGDMFKSLPKADAIFMKWICHDWTDEHCLKLLKNCYEALPENGKVILAEFVVPEAPDTGLSTKNAINLDLIMLAQCPGVKRGQKRNFRLWLKELASKNFTKFVVLTVFGSWKFANESNQAAFKQINGSCTPATSWCLTIFL